MVVDHRLIQGMEEMVQGSGQLADACRVSGFDGVVQVDGVGSDRLDRGEQILGPGEGVQLGDQVIDRCACGVCIPVAALGEGFVQLVDGAHGQGFQGSGQLWRQGCVVAVHLGMLVGGSLALHRFMVVDHRLILGAAEGLSAFGVYGSVQLWIEHGDVEFEDLAVVEGHSEFDRVAGGEGLDQVDEHDVFAAGLQNQRGASGDGVAVGQRDHFHDALFGDGLMGFDGSGGWAGCRDELD